MLYYFAARDGMVSGVTVEGTGTEAFGAAYGIFSARIWPPGAESVTSPPMT